MIEAVLESEAGILGYVGTIHRLEEEMLECQVFKAVGLRIWLGLRKHEL
jgi:hypothetical protein